MSERDTTRRQFLYGLAGTSVIALSGCASDDGSGNGDESGMENGDENGMENGDENGMENGMENGDENGMENGDENGMENGDENGMENGDENGMENGGSMMEPTDPANAPAVSVDRFSSEAGTLFVRENNMALPGPDEPINFDEGPFITTGFGPDGDTIQYYNFDVMPTTPAPIYAFFHENGDPVEGQLNVIDVVPGDEGYNDFWHVHRVTVPNDYQTNTITNAADLFEQGYDIEATGTIKNCPVVPEGSTASKSHQNDDGPQGTVEGWYQGQVVHYLVFEEDSFEAQSGQMPTSPIYVTFNVNAGQDGGGPPSGFRTEEGSPQTHNVVATLPGDAGYSPLWDVKIYDNADFGDVSDLGSATDAEQLADGPNVNCPVVSTE
jgi:hypothetical protein